MSRHAAWTIAAAVGVWAGCGGKVTHDSDLGASWAGSGNASDSVTSAQDGRAAGSDTNGTGAGAANGSSSAVELRSDASGSGPTAPTVPRPIYEYGLPGPSCAGGLDCGGVSCCESRLVPGGTFPMGRSDDGSDACPDYAECDEDEQPEHRATVSPFYLDTFEVTVGRFRRFVGEFTGEIPAGSGAHPMIGNSGWEDAWNAELAALSGDLEEVLDCDQTYPTWTEAPGENETRPINCVNWYEAFAFCAWDNGRLPTEAEWERAAAGGSHNRLYPWGDEEPTLEITCFGMGCDGVPGRSGLGDLPPVGSKPLGVAFWGHQDMGGGLWELVLDRYQADWYATVLTSCDDCANQSQGSTRVRRGSGFNNRSYSLRAANRFEGQAPGVRQFYVGFRCARQE